MTECLYMCQVTLNWLRSHTLLLPDFTFSLSPIMPGGVCVCLSASVWVCVCVRVSPGLTHSLLSSSWCCAALVSGTHMIPVHWTTLGQDPVPETSRLLSKPFVSSWRCLCFGWFPHYLFSSNCRWKWAKWNALGYISWHAVVAVRRYGAAVISLFVL